MRSRPTGIGAIWVAMLVSACGSGEVTIPTTSTLAVSTTTTATTSTTLTTATTVTTASTTTAAATSTTGGDSLPGNPIEFGPAAGDVLAVIGVAHDDVLNLRAAPGADQMILDGIPPLSDSLGALGETRELPGSFWIGVEHEGTEGWVNLRFIGYLGGTSDETAAIVSRLGEVPTAPTMLELGMIVAEGLASDEPSSDIVVSAAPTTGDLGEVTYDVIGLGDDAVRGLRAHVFGRPGSGEFTLDTVEVTTLCGRGVTEEALCV